MVRLSLTSSILALSLTSALVPATASAQRLRDLMSQLFILRAGDEPLFLAGSATSSNPAAVQIHGSHFLPSVAAQNGSVIAFLTGAIASRVANVPIGSTTSAETFRFEGGVPISTSSSAGPILGERAPTLGRGVALAGVSRTSLAFNSIRGVPLNGLKLVFTHENVDFPGCTQEQGGEDCSKLGTPVLENDVMLFDLSIDAEVAVTSFFVTYGLTDRLDIGVVLPVIQASIRGHGAAQILPFGGTTAAHFFAGTPESPVLHAEKSVNGSAFGIGDVAVRLKANMVSSPRTNLALFGEVRLPTGNEEDLLGSGRFSARAIAVLSTTIQEFGAHVNLGYQFTNDSTRNDAVIAVAGFDQRIARGVTLAADLLSEFQVGTSALRLPGIVTYDVPFRRTVNPTNVPDKRDNLISGSFGFKFTTSNRVGFVANTVIPLNNAGLRASVAYTLGAEVAF